jgi:hypothetical protein
MGRSHLQKGHGNTSQTGLLLRGHLLAEVRLHRRLQNSEIRYEIGEIHCEQCSGTGFYLLKWPFLQPLRPRWDAGNVAENPSRLQHPSDIESTERAIATETAAGAGRAPLGHA